jgi:predicted helicase
MPAVSDAAVRAYHAALSRYADVGAAHEQAVKTAFHDLLQGAAAPAWVLVPEFTPPGRRLRYDGALRDSYGFTLGYWEAKDADDDLDREVQRKIERGYSLQNTVFQAPTRALLYQDGRRVLDADLTDPAVLRDLLGAFLAYREPEIERFHEAVAEFRSRIPDLARGLTERIEAARREDPAFRTAFEAFVETCRQSINPGLRAGAVEEMLVQHLLTERLIRRVFQNADFRSRNAIAAEIERVVAALTARHFSRDAFLGQLDRYYRAIEDAAEGIADYAEKQAFLNTVYEQFFQGFSDRVADTHGIVYTPQPLVDFMVRSVDRLLERHFGQTLAAPGVHVLDPFVGTGNFLVRVMEAIPAPELPAKYRAELHANEVMLLPYYVASLNVEHAFFDRTGRYEPFEGIVLVDTFEMVEGKTVGMFSAENTARAERQRNAPIKVIVGNPPYNAAQVNANDANQNRRYPIVDRRVSETYAVASRATLVNKLSDPYVKAFRWASDRVGDAGIVALVTNGSFVDDLSFDGMRRHLVDEFDEVYVVDLGGNVRKNPKLSGTTHNVFGIQVGVAVTFLVRTNGRKPRPGRATLHYASAGADWRKEQKYDWLAGASDLDGLDWRTLQPNARHDWLTEGMSDDWDSFLPLVSQSEKSSNAENETTLCDQYSPGVNSGRDVWVYDSDRERLAERVERFVDTYNAQVVKWQRKGGKGVRPEDVVSFDETEIKWASTLLRSLEAGRFADFETTRIRPAMYRPFVPKWLYYDDLLVDRPGLWRDYFPTSDAENRVLCVSGAGWRTEFSTLMLDRVGDYHLLASADGFQYVPFYVYRADGTREENVTDWALGQFRQRYADETQEITKWDVFHYAYAVLHHPDYRARYAADLRRTLPRLPFAPAFRPFAEAGATLAALHVGFETAPAFPLGLQHAPGTPLTYRVEAMRWADAGKTALRLNDSLTLTGIPEAAHRYRLGNRSALDWLVDQLRVKTDARSGIVHDPNDPADPERLVRLVRQVTHVSVETVHLIEALPALDLPTTPP